MLSRAEILKCLAPDGAEACLLGVKVQPGAKKESFAGLYDAEHLKLVLRAPPVDGAANESLVDFLKESLGVRKSDIRIVSGQKSRIKRLRFALPLADVLGRLEHALADG
jgi:uncharacterized protein (TIGR00251 family)